jgi:polyisoprenoid-binding protein YceI/phage terminase small subunit
MRFLLASLVGAALTVSPPALVREFRIDAGHSDVAFSIGFLGHPVRGRFDDVRGTIVYAPGNPAASGVTVVVGVKSIATGSTHRDEHLRSPDFFDAAKYPVIVFRSATIAARGASFVVTGPLTMHGVTRTVVIPFRETTKPVTDPHGSTLVFFSGHLRIARKDFGIFGGSKFNDWFDELRSATMTDSVDISLDVTGWDADVERTHRYDATFAKVETAGFAPTLTRLRGLLAQYPDSLRDARYDFEQVARGLQQKGRTADAIALLQFCVEAYSSDASARTALARAFEVAGNASAARDQTTRALAMDSLDTRALELARRLGLKPVSANEHAGKDVLLEHDQNADERREGEAMKEHESENPPLVSRPPRRRAGDTNALGIDHLAHHAARAVGRRHQHRVQPQTVGRDLLQTSEQNV